MSFLCYLLCKHAFTWIDTLIDEVSDEVIDVLTCPILLSFPYCYCKLALGGRFLLITFFFKGIHIRKLIDCVQLL